ncbi:MAG: hypothetical protein ABEI52_10760 [Halobacteriaceae archaeon]
MSERIYVTVTDEQAEQIEALQGKLGNSDPDVIRTVVTMWLYQEGLLDEE